MFDNIGGKIKGLAVVICILGIAASVLGGIALISANSRYNPTATAGWIVLIAGSLGSWIGSFTLYGFGELIEKTCENNEALLWMKAEMLEIKQSIHSKNAPETTENSKSVGESPAKIAPEQKHTAAPVSTPIASVASDEAIFTNEVIEKIKALASATEIFNYVSSIVSDEENNNELLKILKEEIHYERLYGNAMNAKDTAVSAIIAYINHGNKVFPVDRSDNVLFCPVCNNMQRSSRKICSSCGVLFRL